MSGARTHFDQLVLSGGGTRCFWQGGFLHRVEDEIGLESLKRICAVSGGVLTACGHVAHIGERIVETTVDVFNRYDSNFDPSSTTGGPSPHEEAYCEIVERCFDEEAISAVVDGPSIEAVLTGLPEKVWDEISITASHALYVLDRLLRRSTTKKFTRAAGVSEVRVDVVEAAGAGQLADLIATAARIPPVFDVDRWHGRRVMDGGAISDAPFPEPDRGNTLILLASHFDNVPHAEGRTFVMPSKTVPTDKIDFTDPSEVNDAWHLGIEDGEAFLETWRQGPLPWNRPLCPA